MNFQSLFQPFVYKNLHLRNRWVMAPMTRMFSPDGVPTRQVADYYARRAAGQVGLILTEGSVVDRPASKNAKDIPNIYGKEALAAWKTVVTDVHRAGGSIAPQIWHVGNTTVSEWRPPAALESPSTMTHDDIQATIAAFAKAAVDAKALGFDAIELHGAHGYLIDQFFWGPTNPREDEYGGKTIRERSRFAIDIVKAIREAVGPDLVIIFRLSQWKQQDYGTRLAETPAELEEWVLPLAEAGVDIFHASQRRYWTPEFADTDLNFAGWIKKITGQPTITVGSVGLDGDFLELFGKGAGALTSGLDELVRRFERGDFDLVAIGRSLLQDPDWVKKVQAGQFDQLKPFDAASLRTLH